MKFNAKSRLQILLLLLPGLLVFGIFTVYPIIRLFWMSFFKWDFGSFLDQEFIALENYRTVLADENFRIAFTNTIVYTLITVPAQMAIGLLVAMLINSINHVKIGFRVAYYLPVITSWVIASLVFKYVFNTEGLLNYFLANVIHVTSQNVRWLDSRWGGMTVAMLLGIWKGIGWNMVVFLAALQTVPLELYESASLDGAGSWQKFIHITLPGIRGTILFALVMLTIGGFNVYTSTKLITGGKPGHDTEVVLTWMYYKAFSNGKFGYSAALSFIIAIVLAVLAVLQFRLMQNKDEG
ncbi:carbohydrate ABC transporter membrane protein 1, CUT1 family [Butyrivibrio proteoclasticus]|uniref:Carbohydrate ABC transporter membrane protein 1, CUT1 family n=1 Tax=Butyrivibrio proteoclasticus TaxID=43305 RepID=A0A1I5S4M5_9FIRM|nr:sugar ABC transporter permease [Butyrivibrio proteoclasticus]SFP65659.1 carbohydrate ABC transporter membrane protein 1, CUT1 family [Butyrivibrio proteoclasticus]